MPSPFPGMDPYIEATGSWEDFHQELISACRAEINRRLPDTYVARVGERVQLYTAADEPVRGFKPDAVVSQRDRNAPLSSSGSGAAGGVATLEPVTVRQDMIWYDPPTESFVEIVHYPDEQVVTTLEVLSPTNKVGRGRAEYLRKRRDLLCEDINFVEIDQLLGGDRLPMRDSLPAGDYHVFLTRRERRDGCEVCSWPVRDRLPTVPVPLQLQDGDVALDLAASFEAAYDRGFFGRQLARRNAAGPPPLLGEADRTWAAGLVSA